MALNVPGIFLTNSTKFTLAHIAATTGWHITQMVLMKYRLHY